VVDLTKRQREIFDYIGKYADKTGYPPTVREIGKAVGLHSSSTVHVHLANLEKAGVLRRDPTKPRAIEVLARKAKDAREAVDTAIAGATAPAGLPLVGRVSAGPGILAEENIEDHVEVPAMIGGRDGDYVLEVRGESMKDAGIIDGDYVVVRPAPDADNGEIVVALLDDEEATVKRIFREDDHLRLQPENETMDPILTTDAQVMGKVIGVFRKV
jgi:repressor LexA